MKKSELSTMVVAELKTLAKKFKVILPAGAKKADIVEAVAAAARKAVAGAKKAVRKTTARKKPAPKKPASPKRVPTKKPVDTPVTEHEWKLPPGTEEPLMAQERVADAKYYTGPYEAAQSAPQPYQDLPRGYGEEKIAIMSRDPFVAYAYWEVTPARLEREKAWFGWNSKLCVRIYDVTGVQFDGRNALGYFDQEVYESLGNWYFDMGRPAHSFCADVGLLSPEGKFLTLARSNYITMPRDGVSDQIDEEWMLVDEEFWRLYGFPGGIAGGLSSQEVREMWARMRMEGISSPGMVSREKAKRK